MEKKTYQKPKTKVVELKVKQQLLTVSGALMDSEKETLSWPAQNN